MTINLTSTGWEENGNISIWTTKKDVASNANFNDIIGIKLDSGKVVNTLEGDDAISGQGSDQGIAIDSGTIQTGSGNDIITGIATSSFGFSGLYNAGNIQTGDGNDIINGVGGFTGLDNIGNIQAGSGNDIITGIATSSVNGAGLDNRVTIDTGDDNDIINGVGNSMGILNNS